MSDRNEAPGKARVLIVGAGPVGMTLCSELARYGVDVRIVDRAARRTDKSKALVLWSRTLELLDRGAIGAAPFVAAGMQTQCVTIMNGDRRIARLDIGGVDTPWPYALMIPQSQTERLLEEGLARQGVPVERNVEVCAVIPGSDHVQAQLRHGDGPVETFCADWLVGCDGAHSMVRHTLGAPFSGETLPSDWILADVHMSSYAHGTDATVYWHRDGVLVIFPIEPGRYRVLCDVPASGTDTPPPPTLPEVQALLDRRALPGMTVSDPIWLAGFRINDRKVAEYRHGRIFLAGDAAHIHSPAGGQGMNTGMQDAFNLAWKLALVIHGAGREAILDSYTPERGAVGDAVLQAAARLTKVATLTNPVAQAMRNFVVHSVLGFSQAQHAVADTITELAIRYAHSPLNGPALPHGLQPGERVPPIAGAVPPGAGPLPRFTLFADRTDPVLHLAASHPDLVDPDIRPPLQADTIRLVRPDGYVACAAVSAEAVARYLADIAPQARPGLA